MSRDIKIKLGINKIGHGSVEINQQFRAPLVLQSCQHHVTEEKSFLRREIWIRTFHGRNDGSTSMKLICGKKSELRV